MFVYVIQLFQSKLVTASSVVIYPDCATIFYTLSIPNASVTPFNKTKHYANASARKNVDSPTNYNTIYRYIIHGYHLSLLNNSSTCAVNVSRRKI
jgi:hypothetical protein